MDTAFGGNILNGKYYKWNKLMISLKVVKWKTALTRMHGLATALPYPG